MKNIDEVRKMFQNDRFATENYAVIDEIGNGYAKCSMQINDRHRNAMGTVMGGASFTLADFAFAVASNHEVMGTVSIQRVKSLSPKPELSKTAELPAIIR